MKAPCGRGAGLSVSEGCLSGHAESGNCKRVELPRIEGVQVCGRGRHWGKAGALCAYHVV